MIQIKSFWFLVLILILQGPKLFSQEIDVSGKWIGIVSANGHVCSYEIEIVQTNTELEGVINLSTFNRAFYALYKIKGRIFDNKIYVEGYEYIENKSGGGYNWCMASLNLTYIEEGSKFYLKGTWGANKISGGCPNGSGKVELKKEKKIISPKINIVENRKIIIRDSITVSNVIVLIDVWDNEKEDGDIISLKIDREWVLRNYIVTKQKRQIKYALDEKRSYLILHAENLGNIHPNTAAVGISDGQSSKTIILNSDMGKSEAILIKRE